MPSTPLDEREFELVNIVGAQLAVNQRELSRHMNLSLGMTNMLLRRLVTKGYIRIKQLDRRKVQYILTPKGFAEKMQKSIKYTLKTIDSIGQVKRRLEALVLDLHKNGVVNFYLLGKSDLVGLIEMTLLEKCRGQYTTRQIESIEEAQSDGVVLVCRESVGPALESIRMVNVIEELAKDETLEGING